MKKQSQLAERLKFLMRARGVTISELAADADISEDTVKSIRSGKTVNPGIIVLTAIADALSCTIDNLIDRTPDDDSEAELLRKWRSLDSHGRSRTMLLIDDQLSGQPVYTSNTRVLRCQTPSAHIGCGALFDNDRSDYIDIPANYMKNASFAVRIISDSYIPTYFPNDIVAVEERRPSVGETAIYIKDNIGYIRKYVVYNGKPHLIPLHGLNGEVELKNTNDYSCVGTIIGIIRSAL